MTGVLTPEGLVKEGEHLVLFIPAIRSALVFRVEAMLNRGFEEIEYGPLPIKADEVMPCFDGGTVKAPEAGVIPARAYTEGKMFPYEDVRLASKEDMWYHKEAMILNHVKLSVSPEFLRIDVKIPLEVTQLSFQNGKMPIGLERLFGYKRGKIEIVHIPEIHYGYRFGNETNLNLYTSVSFTYGEYKVTIPREPQVIFDILTGKIPSYRMTMPIFFFDATIKSILEKYYGFSGFRIFPPYQREAAIKAYEEVKARIKI